MKKIYLTKLLMVSALTALAQHPGPAGEGAYHPAAAACVSPAQRQNIEAALATNSARLRQLGMLPPPSTARPTAVALEWPIRQAPGHDYASVYAVSNFVDHNPAYPNAVQDYNCGSRTYDTGTANHNGTDIVLWPFAFNMMDRGQAEVVAAAAGVIIGKEDGNFDRNCAFSSANWNAVYVQQADGTVCWYGHLKSGTVTSKAVGASVVAGEKLGLVGSSGSSTTPHLHFELHSATGAVLDPYSGPCSPGSSAWATPRPYYESAINALLTHSAPPVFNACPSPETANISSAFMPGNAIILAAYYHDQLAGQTTQYTVYRPDNSVFANWTYATTATHYAASYAYWNYMLPSNAPLGTWRFQAQYQGITTTRTFTVGTVSATATARPAAYELYPNPATNTVRLSGPLPVARVQVLNALGQVVRTVANLTQPTLDLTGLGARGVYLVRVLRADGSVEQHKLALQ